MKNSTLWKCALLALICALLLIPLAMIECDIDDRTAYLAEATHAIAASTAGEQSIKQLFFCKFCELVLGCCAYAPNQGFMVR